MRSRTCALSCLSFLLFGSGTLADVLVPVEQSRSVSGSAFADDASGSMSDSESDQATDFTPFVSAAGVTVFVDNALGSGGGSQNSAILPHRIVAAGSAFANGEGYSFDAFGSGSGSSSFSVTFDVLLPSTYSLTGYVEAFDNGGTSISLRLGASTIFGAGAGNEQVFINDAGVLMPGRYTLSAGSSGSAGGGAGFFDYASGAYDVTLDLTCIGSPYPPFIERGPAGGPADGGSIVLFSTHGFLPTAPLVLGFTAVRQRAWRERF